MPIRKQLYRVITRGPLRPLARRLYDFIISLELSWERTLDRVGFGLPVDSQKFLDHHLTGLIKTFERPQVLRRLVESVRRLYPMLPLIVVDDSRRPTALPGVTLINLPFDSGVSAGRNAGLERVTTPYVLILDDDFIFYRCTDLAHALRVMEAYPQIDLLGGDVINLPFYSQVDFSKSVLFPTQAQPTLPPGSWIGGLPVYDRVANFYIARTERLRQVGWDPQIKRLDHTDFFTRARGVLTTVYEAQLKCLHAQTPFDLAYLAYRTDYQRDQALIRERYFHPSSDTS
jgi:hypothetical protein